MCRHVALRFHLHTFHFKLHHHVHGAVGEVGDLGADFRGVALTQEAGHEGLHHQVLLRVERAVEDAHLEVVGPGKAVQLPLREAVGHGERHLHPALFVAAQGRLEQGHGRQILPQCRGLASAAIELQQGLKLSYGLLGHIHPRALAHAALQSHHCVLSSGIAVA